MLTDTDELETAWEALGAQRTEAGFLTIGLGNSSARFRGGVHYPEGSETLLVGFNILKPPGKTDLPEGAGFRVHIAKETFAPGFTCWVCLSREAAEGRDLFVQMAADILASLSNSATKSDSWLLNLMLARIRAWQDFMQRPRPDVLPLEKEIGLFGELIVLERALEKSTNKMTPIHSWVGPYGGVQDFQTDTNGLEVKSTTSVNGFPARISSLEQLDWGGSRALFLAAIRLCLQDTGRSLPSLIDALQVSLTKHPKLLAHFVRSILLTGYRDDMREKYTRKFQFVEARVFEIDEHFPTISRSETRPEIRAAKYEIDIDLITSSAISFDEGLARSGVSTE